MIIMQQHDAKPTRPPANLQLACQHQLNNLPHLFYCLAESYSVWI
jgi:hypothetical protein